MSSIHNLLYKLPLFFLLYSCISVGNNIYPPHSGSSPISFDSIEEPSSEFIVSDRNLGVLDEYIFRNSSQYQISVDLINTRFIGDITEAINNGIVSKTARIYIPAFDVDVGSTVSFDCDSDGIDDSIMPEIDEVYFNGEYIGNLSGGNSLWKFNDAFDVPIDLVKFPSFPGEQVINKVQIKIDTANENISLSSGVIGCKAWALEVDWVALSFEAAQPIYLLTGLGGSPEALTNSKYVDNIKNTLGLYSKILGHKTANIGTCLLGNLEALNSHAEEIIDNLLEDGKKNGTAEIHLIGHSMGGLDARMLMKKLATNTEYVEVGIMDNVLIKEPLKPLSLLTHGTPHRGTVVADYLIKELKIGGILVDDLCDLSVGTMSIANNALNHFSGAQLATIGSDADANKDGILSVSELAGNQIPFNDLGNELYDLISSVKEIVLDYVRLDIFGLNIPTPIPTFVHINTQSHQPNDTMVSVDSSHAPPGNVNRLTLPDKNHGTIIDKSVQDRAILIGETRLKWGDLQ